MPQRLVACCLVGCLFLALPGKQAEADENLSDADAEKLFIEHVAPLFKGQCLKCHGEGEKLEGKLDLRTRESMLAGGESGDALVPGKPYLSLIYRAVRYDDEIRMPPKLNFSQRLSEPEVERINRWIAAGAPWPATVKMSEVKPAKHVFIGADPTNPTDRLPDYSVPPPDYQYKFGEIFIPAAREDEPKLSVWSAEKAAQYLDDGALVWTRQRQCVACHTNGAYMISRPALTPYLGPPLAEVKTLFQPKRREPQLPLMQRPAARLPIFDMLVACGLAEWDAHVTGVLSADTDNAMRLMCDALSPKGDWKVHSQRWVPYILNGYHDALMFAKAVGTAPGWLDKVRADGDQATLDALERLLKFVQNSQPQNDYDRVYLLWADLRWPGLVEAGQRAELIQMIAGHQRPDGGWSTRSFGSPESWGDGNRTAKLNDEGYGDDPPSDGHMTGLAIIVLREADIAADDERIGRGIAWLKTNQRQSGRWWTRSLNTDYWQLSTYHGTANALLALGMCGEIPRREP